MIRLALTMGWSMTAGGKVGNLIRRFVVPRLHLIPGMRNKILDSKPSALHPLAFVQKSRRPRQLAGTLCPNPFLANGNHLDTELWTGFALITTTPLSSSERVLLEERGAIVHTAEPGSELADWLRRGHATAAIVRPDRTVMRASRNARALCEAMPVFCGTGESLSAATQSAPTGGRDHLGLFLPDLDDEFRDTP